MERVWVAILIDLPEFLGEDAKTTYGPYKAGDVAQISPRMAEILEYRGWAIRLPTD